jgi:hypothetical protein
MAGKGDGQDGDFFVQSVAAGQARAKIGAEESQVSH